VIWVDTDPETWRWVWLAASVVLTAGEMTVAGTFILIPFGLSALVAMVLAFAGVSLIVQWLVFVPLSGALFALFWRHASASMKNMAAPAGAGESRLVGALGSVISEIPDSPSDSGMVRIGGEEWRAVTDGEPIAEGSRVKITSMRGTRVVVTRAAEGEN